MLSNGNDNTRVLGIIHQVQGNNTRIEFPQFGKEMYIPNFFIHSPIRENQTITQMIEIETWFLKRNRIIPIN